MSGHTMRQSAVSFMRHSIAVHNEAAARSGPNDLESVYLCEAYADASLSDRGFSMVHDARDTLQGLQPTPDIVLTSPLTRAIQTAIAMFEGTGIPIVVLPEIREAYGRFPCDRHQDKPELVNKFDGVVDLSLMEDMDTMWNADCREDMTHLANRAAKFLDSVLRRGDGHVFVVSHGVFMEVVIHQLLQGYPGYDEKHRVQNCEVHSFIFSKPDDHSSTAVGGRGGWELVPPSSALQVGAGGTVAGGRGGLYGQHHHQIEGTGMGSISISPYLECYLGGQTLIRVCASGLSLGMVTQLNKAFWRVSSENGLGLLDEVGFASLLSGCSLTPQEMKWLLCAMDREWRGMISFDDLLTAITAFYSIEGATNSSITHKDQVHLQAHYQWKMSGTTLSDRDTLVWIFRQIVTTLQSVG